MSRPAVILAGISLLLVFGGGILQHRSPEVLYKGRPAGYWLGAYRSSDRYEEAEYKQALGTLGPNALPTLFQMLNAREFPGMGRFWDWYNERTAQHPGWQHVTATDQMVRALRGFQMLGTNAGPEGARQLMQHYRQTPRGGPWKSTYLYLLCFSRAQGEPVVPDLVAVVRNGANAGERKSAAQALGQIGARPELVVPVLVAALEDGDADVVSAVVRALGDFGSAAAVAVPRLRELAASPAPPQTLVVGGCLAYSVNGAERALDQIVPGWRSGVVAKSIAPPVSN